MQHIWSKTLLAITHGRIPPFWINFQRLTKSLHPNHQLLLSSSFFNVDRFLLQITNSTEGLLSTAVLTQIIPAPTYTIAQSLSGITLTSQFTSIHECLFVEANSKRDIWDIKKTAVIQSLVKGLAPYRKAKHYWLRAFWCWPPIGRFFHQSSVDYCL